MERDFSLSGVRCTPLPRDVDSAVASACRSFLALLSCAVAFALAGCSGSLTDGGTAGTPGSTYYTVGGTVAGLTGTGLTLQDNNGDDLDVAAAAGSFTFHTPLTSANAYNVTVLTQPGGPAQTCLVKGGSGTVEAGNVSNVTVICASKNTVTDTISGTTTGLAGVGLVLQNDGADNLSVSADGVFAFATGLSSAMPYAVTVLTPPMNPYQNCSVSNGNGTTSGGDVNDVGVSCVTTTSTPYPVGGTISGVAATGPIVLQDNATNSLTVSKDGNFTFSIPIPAGSAYSITALASATAASRTCTFTNATGIVGSGPVTNVNVVCAATASAGAFTIAGTIAGLAAGNVVALMDNGGDALTAANGPFTFATPIAYNGAYSVTVATQPAGQTCSVTNGAGAGVQANVTTVQVICSTLAYTVAGSIAGLAAGNQVTLIDNGGNALTASDGGFTFGVPIAYDGTYSVTVATQPVGQICTVANGTGGGVTANVTSVVVTCSTDRYTIGGTISGLAAGALVTLDDNGANPLTAANGAFTFTTPVAFDSSYLVTVGTQPMGQTCTVTNGSGDGVTANVTNVTVICSTNTFTIGGTVTGLAAGAQVTLDDNGGNALTVRANGAFVFTTPVASGGSYSVTVGTEPRGQTCTVINGTGAGVAANVTSVGVACSATTFTIGGTVTGLAAGVQATLRNNGGNALIVTGNGPFMFSTKVAYNSSYVVTVGTQPTGQTCSVTNGTGGGVTANVTNVGVICANKTYTIGGMVSGLAPGAQVTLDDNGDSPLTVTANGAFTFTTPVAYDGAYAVTVGTQPATQVCSVTNATGAGVVANVTNVVVMCATKTFTISGTVNGLSAGTQVTLDDNAGDALTVGNGAFTFSTPVADGGTYNVTVGTQPTGGQTCTVTNGMGTATANVNSVTVNCTVPTFTIGGTLSGLAEGQQVTLEDNGGNPLTVTASGPFQFTMPVASGGSYSVSVGTDPTMQSCTVANGTGANVTANVTTVNVTCVNTYTIGGQVSGSPGGFQVTLQDNRGDPLNVSVGPTGVSNFTFSTAVANGGAYDVVVSTQPTGYHCTVADGAGTVNGANVANVAVSCTVATFTISGTLAGDVVALVDAGSSLTLEDNGGDALTINSDNVGNGNFTFPTPIAYGTTYSVTVATPPAGQTCTVTSGMGTATANVTNVGVTCSDTYTIGGTVSFPTYSCELLPCNSSVTLNDNGGDALTVTGGPGSVQSFTFAGKVASGGSYSVTVPTQPSGMICTVAGAAGTVDAANVTTVNVTCVFGYPVGGTVQGLASLGATYTLTVDLSNGAGVTASCSFTDSTSGGPCSVVQPNSGTTTFQFPTALAVGTAYTVAPNPNSTGNVRCLFTPATTNNTFNGTDGAGSADAFTLTCSPPVR